MFRFFEGLYRWGGVIVMITAISFMYRGSYHKRADI